MKLELLTALAATCVPLVAQPAPNPPTLRGNWGGWMEYRGRRSWLHVRSDRGTLRIDDFNTFGKPHTARDVVTGDSRVRFTYLAPIGAVSFTARVRGTTLGGTLSLDGSSVGTFELRRLHEVSDDRLARQVGRYELADGRIAWVIPRTFGGLRVVWHRGEGTRYGDYEFDGWLPTADDCYIEGVVDKRQPRTLQFDAKGFEIRGSGGFRAHKTSGGVEILSFRSGPITLRGWLLMPPGTVDRAAVAYAHGSGYVSADSFFDVYTSVRLVRKLGCAVLRWDKRGVFRSGGDQGFASYGDLADDVLAAVRWLRSCKRIDRDRIGIGGLSQAPSFVLPLAAARSKAVKFVIATSASTQTIAATNVFNWTNRMRRKGFSEAQVRAARSFFERLFPLAVDPTADGQRDYDAFLARFEREAWFDYAVELAGLRTPLADPAIDRWRKIWHVDPIDAWRTVTCPVLFTWGIDDRLVNATASALRIAQLAARTGQRNFTSILYPSPAAHAVGTANTPTFFDDVAAWWSAKCGERR